MPGEARTAVGHRTREALLDAGIAVAERHGLAGLSVNRVVAEAGVAKGTFYVHFADRGVFIDALHERFHALVHSAVAEATRDMPAGAEFLVRSAEAYLDVSLENRVVKALALEARSDPTFTASMSARHDRLASAAIPSFEAMGWPDPTAAAQLMVAMTAEIAVRELDAGSRLPASRRALRRFLGVPGQRP
ncbi:MAG: TetR/AcrR family transcriptional regulator [Chloroflexi bacterium]|nr:MAG: TetR/AcrR family transcriptional regulator [Chloroflexota bacterium]